MRCLALLGAGVVGAVAMPRARGGREGLERVPMTFTDYGIAVVSLVFVAAIVAALSRGYWWDT